MFRWYQNSNLCCVYLIDVPEQPHDFSIRPGVSPKWNKTFRQARWLTRGWTLQEFLAPSNISFFSKDWKPLVKDEELLGLISMETGIPTDAMENFKASRWSIAQRMSWAANRETTRVEDKAYSLLGIFNVNMPLLYGEGDRAFLRLQEEIIKSSLDQSIFCWKVDVSLSATWRGLLAQSAAEFAGCGNIVENHLVDIHPFQTTNKGIQLTIQKYIQDEAGNVLALMNCHGDTLGPDWELGIWLRRIHDNNYVRISPHKVSQYLASETYREVSLQEPMMVYVKTDLTNHIWRKCDMCQRVSGFRFLLTSNENDDLWAQDITPKDRFNWDTGIFSFNFDPDSGEPQVAVTKCLFGIDCDCDLEIWVRFDSTKNYGVSRKEVEEENSIQSSQWNESQCCEWKSVNSNCEALDFSLSSWLELGDNGEPYIHIEVEDKGIHDFCADQRDTSIDGKLGEMEMVMDWQTAL